MMAAVRIIGIDPGLRSMGWGVIEANAARLMHVANGAIRPDDTKSLPERLRDLHEGLSAVIRNYEPCEAAVEETFVNRDPQSALRLGQARGIALAVPSLLGLSVAEYAANLIKKTVTGTGHAGKRQVALMVSMLLPGCEAASGDAADALAAAITHARLRSNAIRLLQR
ncbi:MAG TPA: crossover junction endodeoxyribonuclease RuvC [Methylocella sp.]|nr:crossover junction endodeoxyribonuclease RuvC [Methylocella sp.]